MGLPHVVTSTADYYYSESTPTSATHSRFALIHLAAKKTSVSNVPIQRPCSEPTGKIQTLALVLNRDVVIIGPIPRLSCQTRVTRPDLHLHAVGWSGPSVQAEVRACQIDRRCASHNVPLLTIAAVTVKDAV
jgi:hypothetical protein